MITLVIVGVVAALTIPNMIIQHQKQETVTRLKKVYSTLSNALDRAKSDYGPIYTWGMFSSWGGAATFANTYLYPYLRIQKKCGCNGDKSCFFEYKNLNGSGTTIPNTCVSTRFFLDDGTFIYVSTTGGNADGSCPVSIYADLNGQKGPNTLGRDIFPFMVYTQNSKNTMNYSNKVIPYRWQSADCCTRKHDGRACTLKIFEDGFQIKDDYPW